MTRRKHLHAHSHTIDFPRNCECRQRKCLVIGEHFNVNVSRPQGLPRLSAYGLESWTSYTTCLMQDSHSCMVCEEIKQLQSNEKVVLHETTYVIVQVLYGTNYISTHDETITQSMRPFCMYRSGENLQHRNGPHTRLYKKLLDKHNCKRNTWSFPGSCLTIRDVLWTILDWLWPGVDWWGPGSGLGTSANELGPWLARLWTTLGAAGPCKQLAFHWLHITERAPWNR
jgi:hypothetical protein